MSDIVIRVENLSKKYTLGQKSNGAYGGLRHALQNAATAPWRMLKKRKQKTANGVPSSPQSSTSDFQLSPSEAPSPSDFWALKDVSFEVKRGEVLGIIGRNGAGKSTLLKILSRITEPTSGRIGIKGRVASLLEVGTGFHPELTGRENIFLNGAILGMTRQEVKRKFDEIVDFASVEKFLDTPVKHYSSGMYVRLAFAVAAHLESEILIVDEVLAVGDSEFQRKCLGKMKDVASGGRTLLFVSHNMSAIHAMCSSAILLSAGQSACRGEVEEITRRYSCSGNASQASTRRLVGSRPGRKLLSIGPQEFTFPARQSLIFNVELSPGLDELPCHYAMNIWNDAREIVATVSTEHLDGSFIPGDVTKFSLELRSPLLLPGTYEVDCALYLGGGLDDKWEGAMRFTVSESISRGPFSAQSGKGCRFVLSDFCISPNCISCN